MSTAAVSAEGNGARFAWVAMLLGISRPDVRRGFRGGEIGMTIGEVFGFLLVGCIVGPVARFIVPGDDPMPIWMTIVLGAVGAFLGGWLLADVITPHNEGIPWIAAILAAAVLVVLVRLVRRGTTGSTHHQLS
jgi:uncharacterized membrane protein YeaQ/YmgE (transglycosylase-associated protein family)